MSKKITFYINNEAYTVNIGEDKDNLLENELKSSITTDKNINTKELLTAFIQQTHKIAMYEEQLKEIVKSIPDL
jgi:hypothetical protein